VVSVVLVGFGIAGVWLPRRDGGRDGGPDELGAGDALPSCLGPNRSPHAVLEPNLAGCRRSV